MSVHNIYAEFITSLLETIDLHFIRQRANLREILFVNKFSK